MGELEAPSIWRLEFRGDPAKHVVLLTVEPHSPDRFFPALRAQVIKSVRKEAFVFIHGFNVTFEDAARRTAQMTYDLAFDGAPILYSWPSQGKPSPLGYTTDETNAEWTVPNLKEFLIMVATQSGAQTVHLIAHSMGSRALTRALENLIAKDQGTTVSRFKEVILAAPDIDAEVFKNQIVPKLRRAEGRVTLYASSEDEALRLSKKVHGYQRAGEMPPPFVVPGVDTIDASSVDTSLVGHSYFAENRSVLSDIFYLLRDRKPPDKRHGLRPKEHGGLRFWVFQP